MKPLLLWPFVGVHRFVSSFHPRALPPMMRHSYSKELVCWWLLPLMLAAVEGSVIAVLVKNTFEDVPGVRKTELNYVVAMLQSAPSIAHLSSFMWAAISLGRRKVPMIQSLQIAMCVAVVLIGLAPHTRIGLYLLAGCVLLARVCWSGVITMRTGVWRANYPRADRTRIAGQLSSVQSVVITVAGAVIGLAVDWHPSSYHIVFFAAALGGVLGTWVYRGVRLRGERRLMRAEAEGKAEQAFFNPLAIVNLLRRDRKYAGYMACMFVFGMGNFVTTSMLAIILRDQFRYDNFEGILITTVLPRIAMLSAIPLWAPLLSGRHVVRYRSIHSWTFVLASTLAMLAVGYQSGWLLMLMAIVLGTGFGGGELAWNLGHHDFAGDHNAAQYMGVHVTLTGVRGVLAPFVAVSIYEALLRVSEDAGNYVFGVSLILNLAGAIGFNVLRRVHRM